MAWTFSIAVAVVLLPKYSTAAIQSPVNTGVISLAGKCSGTTRASSAGDAFSATSSLTCHGANPGLPATTAVIAPTTRTVDCGAPQSTDGHLPTNQAAVCAGVQQFCALPPTAAKNPHITTEVIQKQNPDGSWTQLSMLCHVVLGRITPAQVTAQMASDAARRLLPHPAVRTTGAGSPTLINIETVLWIDTPAERNLGTLTLLGHRVDLRAQVKSVDWNFGDNSTDTTTGPEPGYQLSNPCRTVTCPDYYGHVYRDTGTPSISASLTWTGQYRVDAGPWLSIGGTVSAPATPTTITVRQARGILVPNPGEH